MFTKNQWSVERWSLHVSLWSFLISFAICDVSCQSKWSYMKIQWIICSNILSRNSGSMLISEVNTIAWMTLSISSWHIRVEEILRRSIFRKFDIAVFTQNIYQVWSNDISQSIDIGFKSPRLRINQFLSIFVIKLVEPVTSSE